MKFLCIKCDEPMVFKEMVGPEADSVSVTFVCKRCGSSFAMLTNPMETQIVKGLGVHIGGRTIPYRPMEVIENTMVRKEEDASHGDVVWTEEAEKRLQNIPAFIRPMAKKGIERMAKEKGYREITPEIMAEARERFMG